MTEWPHYKGPRKRFYMNCPCPCGGMVQIYTDEYDLVSDKKIGSIQDAVKARYNRLSDVPTLESPERHMYFIPANEDWDCNVLEAHWFTVRKKRTRQQIMLDYHMNNSPYIQSISA